MALVERVSARHRGIATSTGVDFNHSVPPTPAWVTGDVTLIEQAVTAPNGAIYLITGNNRLTIFAPQPVTV